ncbi:YfiR family protein [Microbulbifer guangxiensis]|uniref:YfiR family protein n=1 Tax=Microbulbifer guangxiensis TaxID=2904249 RepID=UPI001F32EFA9|nr:YfiR family protein [Microbulbifer guangxiensis]
MKSSRLYSGIHSLRRAALVGACVVVILFAGNASASPRLSETEAGRLVMVNYIIHFAHHIQWPIEAFNGTGAPFRVCIVGDDQIREPLWARLKHQSIDGRRASVETLAHGELRRARDCQLLLMLALPRADQLEIIGALQFFPVLTMSDSPRFAATGGMVEFSGSGSNVALRLNKTMLERAELKTGSSLFRLTRLAP